MTDDWLVAHGATKVPEEERSDFLPDMFGIMMVEMEARVFNTMSQACPDYKGGYWEFYTLPGSGFMILQSSEEKLHLVGAMNYYDGEMSPEAASLAVCAMAYNHAVWAHAEAHENFARRLQKKWDILMQFIYGHPEIGQISRFLD